MSQVVKDKPSAYLRLSDRKSTRQPESKGTLTADELGARFAPGCELEHEGPIKSAPINRFRYISM